MMWMAPYLQLGTSNGTDAWLRAGTKAYDHLAIAQSQRSTSGLPIFRFIRQVCVWVEASQAREHTAPTPIAPSASPTAYPHATSGRGF